MGRDGVEYEEVALLAVLRCLLAAEGVLLVSKMVGRMRLRVQTLGRERGPERGSGERVTAGHDRLVQQWSARHQHVCLGKRPVVHNLSTLTRT